MSDETENPWRLRITRLIAERPAVIGATARSKSMMVREIAAGSRYLTDPALQEVVAGLDEPLPKSALDHKAARIWTQLAANPVLEASVAEKLAVKMAEAGMTDNAEHLRNGLRAGRQRLAGPLESERNPAVLFAVTDRALNALLPTGQWFRAYDLVPLLRNPNLDDLIARKLAVRLGQAAAESWRRGENAYPPFAEALDVFTQRFPHLYHPPRREEQPQDAAIAEPAGSCDPYEQAFWDRRVARVKATGFKLLDQIGVASRDPLLRLEQVRDGRVPLSEAALTPTERIRQVAILDERLGENDVEWRTAFAVAPGFTGTVLDLVDVVKGITCQAA